MMGSRENILKNVAANQPPQTPLPDLAVFKIDNKVSPTQFADVLHSIGGHAIFIDSINEVAAFVSANYGSDKRVVSLAKGLQHLSTSALEPEHAPHKLANVDLAIIDAHFAVCENGAVWITDEDLGHRALPFICENLIAIVTVNNLLPTMHEAYDRLENTTYGFGTFIAGPSKTADIEQSLVLGAHGPVSMTVFVVGSFL